MLAVDAHQVAGDRHGEAGETGEMPIRLEGSEHMGGVKVEKESERGGARETSILSPVETEEVERIMMSSPMAWAMPGERARMITCPLPWMVPLFCVITRQT